MRLLDLDPRWIERDGTRIGFVFRSPTKPEWWQSCFTVAVPRQEQWKMLKAVTGGRDYQACRPDFAWTAEPALDQQTFEALTVAPSLDGSAGGLWHGFIQNGQIEGGI